MEAFHTSKRQTITEIGGAVNTFKSSTQGADFQNGLFAFPTGVVAALSTLPFGCTDLAEEVRKAASNAARCATVITGTFSAFGALTRISTIC